MSGFTDRAPFVGRQREIARLVERLRTTGSDGGGLVLVGGEPGIGKTRLVQEHADRARTAGWLVLTGRAYDTAGMPPYLPFAEALRPYMRSSPLERLCVQLGASAYEVGLIVPDLHQRLTDLRPSPPLSPEHERYRLFERVTDFLLAIAHGVAAAGDAGADPAHPGPSAPPSGAGLLMVLDDLHWADAPTLHLLLHLARRLGEAPLLVVGTHRTVELGPAHPLTAALADLQHERLAEGVALDPLSPEDAATFTTALAGGPVAPELLRAIYQETEGLPFFVEEVVRQLRHEGRELTDAGRVATGDWGLPEGVQQAIGRRLARLSPAAQQLVQAGAVLGDGFRFEVAAAMCYDDPTGAGPWAGGHDRLLDALDEALTAGVLHEDGAGYQFHHALIRRSLIDALTLPRRQRLHLRAAEALEYVHARDLGPHVGALAMHYHQAGPAAAPETTIRYLLLAAEASAAAFAWEEAAARWQAALDLLPTGDDERRGALLVALGDAQQQAGDFQDAQTNFRDAAELARRTTAPERLARAALGFAQTVAAPFGPLQPEAVALLETALEALEAGDSTLRALLLGQLVWLQIFTAPWERRNALSERAIAMARRLGDLPTLAVVLVQQLYVLTDARLLAEREAIIAEVVALAERIGDPTLARDAYQFQVVAAVEAGEAEAVEQAIERYDALAQRLRSAAALERALQLRAMREMLVGRLAVAENLFAQAAVRTDRMLSPGALRQSTVELRYLYLFQGLVAELAAFYRGQAAELAAGMQAIWQAAAATPGVLQRRVQVWHAYILARAGRLEEARVDFEQVAAHDFADLDRTYDAVLNLAHLAETSALLADGRRAALLYRRLLPERTRGVVGNYGTVFYGAVDHYLGLLAATLLRAGRPARAAVGAGRLPVEEPDTAEGMDRETAEAHFEAALAFHTRLGARMWVAHTQVAHAALLLDRRRPDDLRRARELLDEAVATFSALGIDHAAAEARQLLTTPPLAAAPAAAPTFPDGLSAREVDVLRLLAAGKSNREIADTLVISYNTVERHINHIFAKTGVANRVEAATYAHRHGLAD